MDNTNATAADYSASDFAKDVGIIVGKSVAIATLQVVGTYATIGTIGLTVKIAQNVKAKRAAKAASIETPEND